MAVFRDPTVLVFIDQDNHELARIDAKVVPRAGENVRLKQVPYVVERVGYDVPVDQVATIFVVLRPA